MKWWVMLYQISKDTSQIFKAGIVKGASHQQREYIKKHDTEREHYKLNKKWWTLRNSTRIIAFPYGKIHVKTTGLKINCFD